MRRNRARYQLFGVTIESALRLPGVPRGRDEPADCVIVSGAVDGSDRAEWFHEWRLRRRSWLSIGRCPDGYVLRFHGMADFGISADGRRVTVAPGPALPDETLRHLLLDQVLPLALSRHGGLLLHASAVHLPGVGTVGFAGATGRGKSTLAAAMTTHGGRVLTDDCLALAPDERHVLAYAGYPGLRLWPAAVSALLGRAAAVPVAHYSRKRRSPAGVLPFRRSRSPLRALFLLSPRAASGDAVRMQRVRPAAAVAGLVRFAYLIDVDDRRDLRAVFDKLSALVSRVPVVRLRIRHGFRQLPHAAEAVRRYAAALSP